MKHCVGPAVGEIKINATMNRLIGSIAMDFLHCHSRHIVSCVVDNKIDDLAINKFIAQGWANACSYFLDWVSWIDYCTVY